MASEAERERVEDRPGPSFTPGPWVTSRANWRGELDPHNVYVSGDVTPGEDDDDETATAVAVVVGNATSKGVTAANARLIAHAPSLADQVRRDAERFREIAEWFRSQGWLDLAGRLELHVASAFATLGDALGREEEP
jgi:hypothetical protein